MTSTLIKASSFNLFLRDVWSILMKSNKDNKSIWIIMDNSSVHKYMATDESITNNIKFITISPYSSQLNKLRSELKRKWTPTKQLI